MKTPLYYETLPKNISKEELDSALQELEIDAEYENIILFP